MSRDLPPHQKLSNLVAEVVAVPSQQVVRVHGEPVGDLGEELLQQLLRDVRLAHRYHLHGPAKVGAPGVPDLNAASKVVFLSVNHDACVPDAVDLPAQQSGAHGSRHPLGQVVEVQGDLMAALAHRDVKSCVRELICADLTAVPKSQHRECWRRARADSQSKVQNLSHASSPDGPTIPSAAPRDAGFTRRVYPDYGSPSFGREPHRVPHHPASARSGLGEFFSGQRKSYKRRTSLTRESDNGRAAHRRRDRGGFRL